jgi:hypothetical protein
VIFVVACTHASPPAESPAPTDSPRESDTPAAPKADVVAVEATGDPGATVVGVSIRSDDVDCTQYADWWELIADDGTLVYRRILDHSHPDEQPFLRTGDPIALDPARPLWVRAHLHPDGYGGATMHGSVSAGFVATAMPDGFAAGLATSEPLPTECLF